MPIRDVFVQKEKESGRLKVPCHFEMVNSGRPRKKRAWSSEEIKNSRLGRDLPAVEWVFAQKELSLINAVGKQFPPKSVQTDTEQFGRFHFVGTSFIVNFNNVRFFRL